MLVLLQHLWPALAAAALVGFVLSLLFGLGHRLPSARWPVLVSVLALLAIAALLAWLQLVPGRPGLWLDIGLACAIAYMLGAAVGTALRSLITRRRDESIPVPPRATGGVDQAA